MIDLSHLSSAEFEELVYDLLREIGAKNLSWRKGTSRRGTAADSGRDIECSFHFEGPTGEPLVDRRFVQCKHYREGVPPDRLESGLSWAQAARPDTLLIVASGFLSNPAKDYLEQYRKSHHPEFRIQLWENPDLEMRLASHPSLRRKFRLSPLEPALQILHPAHISFATSIPILSLNKLFELLDSADPPDRESFLGVAAISIVQPTVRKPRTGKESLMELVNEDMSYSAVRTKALALPLDPMLVAAGIVTLMLAETFNSGNYLRAPQVRASLREFCDFMRRRAESGATSKDSADKLIANYERDIADTENRLRNGYQRYLRFCDKILQPLLEYRPEPVLPDWAHEMMGESRRG